MWLSRDVGALSTCLFVLVALFFASGALQHSYIIEMHCYYHTFFFNSRIRYFGVVLISLFVCFFVCCMPCPAWERLGDICNDWNGGSYRQALAFFLFLFLDCMHQVLHFASHTTARHFNITS